MSTIEDRNRNAMGRRLPGRVDSRLLLITMVLDRSLA
jgi:hypothetical protein